VKWFVLGAGATLPITGGTLSGPLILAADPAVALGAATKQYADAGSAAAEHNVGRSYIHNGLMNIAQRGAGPFSANGYTLDRFTQYMAGGDTLSTSQVAATDADRAAIGDESCVSYMQCTFAGTNTATSQCEQSQPAESVRRFAGKTMTISLWAKASVGSPRLCLSYSQNFGQGGSPSATVYGVFGTTPALTTAWARYSFTATIPSSAGKILGTTVGTDQLSLFFWLSAAPSNTAATIPSGGIGVQSGTIGIWGVQLELGGSATPLEKLDPRNDLANCQRFYQTGQAAWNGYGAAGQAIGAFSAFPVTMRAGPTMTITGANYTNASGAGIQNTVPYGMQFFALATATGNSAFNGAFTASADL
jgi:hypothetical protein